MKRIKILFLLAAVAMTPGAVYAALPIYEPFADATANGGTSYTVGDPVPGQSNDPTTGVGAHWFAAGAAGANNTIAAGNLSIPGLAASSGNMMEYGVSSGPSARLNLDATYSSGTLYYSFALKVTDLGSLGTSGGFSVAFNNAQNAQAGTPTVNSASMMMRSISGQPGDFNIGVRKGGGTPTWSATTFHTNDTIFVVGSYIFNTGSTTDDVAKMWLNPASSTFGGATPADDLVFNQAGIADINSPGIASLVFWRRLDANSTLQPADMFSDEIRVGTTWADVTPAAGVQGDYNGDLKVDAADYAAWRADPGSHGGDPGGYNTWRGNFGFGSGSGSRSGLNSQSVPEPASLVTLLGMVATLCVGWRRRSVIFC